MARPLIRGLCAVVLAGSAGAAILLGGNAPASAAVTSTGPGYAVPANAVDPIAFMQRMNAPLGVLTTR
jgi:hypothetical protein